jgi:hypothetical protein
MRLPFLALAILFLGSGVFAGIYLAVRLGNRSTTHTTD